jgi:hypothetical protein
MCVWNRYVLIDWHTENAHKCFPIFQNKSLPIKFSYLIFIKTWNKDNNEKVEKIKYFVNIHFDFCSHIMCVWNRYVLIDWHTENAHKCFPSFLLGSRPELYITLFYVKGSKGFPAWEQKSKWILTKYLLELLHCNKQKGGSKCEGLILIRI